MTLPVSGAISMSQVAVELGLASNANINLNHPWVRLLAGVPSGAISISSLRGKTGRYDGTLTGSENAVQLNDAPLWSGTLNYIFSQSGQTTLIFDNVPIWTGHFRITNNSTGQSVVCVPTSGQPNQWSFNDGVTNIVRNGIADSYSIIPV